MHTFGNSAAKIINLIKYTENKIGFHLPSWMNKSARLSTSFHKPFVEKKNDLVWLY